MKCAACHQPIVPERDAVKHHTDYARNVTIKVHPSCHRDIHLTEKYPEFIPIDSRLILDRDLENERLKNGQLKLWRFKVLVGLDSAVNRACHGWYFKEEFIQQAVREKLEKMGIPPTENGNGKQESEGNGKQ